MSDTEAVLVGNGAWVRANVYDRCMPVVEVTDETFEQLVVETSRRELASVLF